jgi:glucan phosphoethanolaminetransferase (alkaline phosphatase superfamily)
MPNFHIHHLVILVSVSAIAQWLLGILWYRLIFRKTWKNLTGLTESEKPANTVFSMIAALIACGLLSYVLVNVVAWAGANDFTAGMGYGVLCWLGFMAPPLFTQHIFERRRANLFAINAAYWLLAMALGGGILAACR